MVHVHWHIVYWDAGPARASDSVNPILLWTDSADSDHRQRQTVYWTAGPMALSCGRRPVRCNLNSSGVRPT